MRDTNFLKKTQFIGFPILILFSDALDLEKNDKYEINDMHIDNFDSSVNVDLESYLVNSTQDNEIVVHAQELGFCDTQFHEQKNKDCNSILILSNNPKTLVIEDTVEEESKILDPTI